MDSRKEQHYTQPQIGHAYTNKACKYHIILEFWIVT